MTRVNQCGLALPPSAALLLPTPPLPCPACHPELAFVPQMCQVLSCQAFALAVSCVQKALPHPLCPAYFSSSCCSQFRPPLLQEALESLSGWDRQFLRIPIIPQPFPHHSLVPSGLRFLLLARISLVVTLC